ncbi:MAG: RHS repeat-associated core domain-containing protein, partial [Kiritimatiellaeota bacterium]|nr:RHS repeat-associated core domain-containing protein [Kiritimatiellota bacterium]
VRYLDAPVLRDRDADGQSYNGLEERLYYTGDAHFNVTALVNTSGVVVERYEYDPYGKVTVLSSDFTGVRPTSLYDNQVLFSGYRFDPETGLYKVRHRDFHSTLGVWTTRDPIADPVFVTLNQWLSRDPIGERGGKNLYTFVNNNALCYIDDLGQKTMIVVDAIEWDEAWALIYRVGYFCKCNQQGVCGWVRSGNHKGLLEGVVAPWLRFEQKVQYSIEKSGSISFLSDLTGLIPGEWTGAISGLVIELLNTKTTKGKRTMIGELKTIEVIPLPKMKELGECSCKTSNTADTKDELTVKLFAGGVETTNSSVPP